MAAKGRSERDLKTLVVRRVGQLEETADLWEPYRLITPDGGVVSPASEYLKDLQAAGRSVATQRSYGMDLLRWFRFLWAVEVPWDQATMDEGRDFCRWLQIGTKPAVAHWRRHGDGPASRQALVRGTPGPNAVTGKAPLGHKYALITAAHAETVVRNFYAFHLDAGTGPMVNPFPLASRRRPGRPLAHHNPMEPFRNERAGRYRPKLVTKPPRCIPDGAFNELFAKLGPHRDRALVAFWVSTGARASELLGARCCDVDVGQQLVTVVRKGSRAMQALPASPDAFVWLRLYQAGLHGMVPAGRDDPLWWTLARPFRQLNYHAAYRMFSRANAELGANWSLHDLRHTAAYRMARDPEMPLTDVQWILGHARLETTQIYVRAPEDEIVASILAHYVRRSEAPAELGPPPGYRAESLEVLFGATS